MSKTGQRGSIVLLGEWYNLDDKAQARALRTKLKELGWKEHRGRLIHDQWPAYESLTTKQAVAAEQFHHNRSKQ